jgi:heme exporter protein B
MSVAVREAGFIGKSLALARKDVRIELRARETLLPMLAFSLAVTVVLSFVLPGTSDLRAPVDVPAAGTVELANVIAGFLWITILFAGLIGFARTFAAEHEDGAMDALLLVPIDRSGLWFGKAMANLAFIMLVELFLVPAFALLFGFHIGAGWPALLAVIALVDIGFVAVGTLFSALAAHTRSRELILPMLALPALIPLFIAGVELSAELFVGGDLGTVAATGWFAILIAFDVIITTVAALVFEFAIEP